MNFKAVLTLPKTARSAQTHKSISFIWIVWSTLYVYLWLQPVFIESMMHAIYHPICKRLIFCVKKRVWMYWMQNYFQKLFFCTFWGFFWCLFVSKSPIFRLHWKTLWLGSGLTAFQQPATIKRCTYRVLQTIQMKLILFVSGQIGPYWAELKLL